MARTGKLCNIRISGIPLPKWLKGVWISERTAKVTEDDPLWEGAEIGEHEATIRLLPEEDERRRYSGRIN